MKKNFRIYMFGILFGVLLTGFTVYLMMDTFIIERVYEVPFEEYDYSLFRNGKEEGQTAEPGGDPAQSGNEALLGAENRPSGIPETAQSASEETAATTGTTEGEVLEEPTEDGSGGVKAPFTAQPVKTENSYTDEHIAVFLSETRIADTTVYAAEVYLSSAEYLKTAFARGQFGRNLTDETSDIAKQNNAIFAVNGDFYGAREKGYVLRNGQLCRSSSSGRDALVIYPDGSFEIVTEGETSAQELKEKGAWQVFSFGPALIVDGEISVGKNDEVGQARISNPRTAVGIIDELHYLFIVSEGRVSTSKGLSLYELATLMRSCGVKTAYNLDGGGSSTMYFNGRVINTTVDGRWKSERSVSDIVYIG